jgi:hypothetical protein
MAVWSKVGVSRAGATMLLSALLMVAGVSELRADPALEAVLKPETTVWITDSTGREQKLRIIAVADEIVHGADGGRSLEIPRREVRRVRARRSDSVLNGALIGAGSALAAGLYFCTLIESWEICRDDVGPMLRISALGAGIGIGVDALIRGRKTIYEDRDGTARLHASPLIGRRGAGLQLSLSF